MKLWVELKDKKGAATLLGVYYRPPDSQRDTEEQICAQLWRCVKTITRGLLYIGNFTS